MTKVKSEVDALKEIDTLFEPLTPEERQRIFGFVGAKYNNRSSKPFWSGNEKQ